MKLRLTHFRYALVDELFGYKASGFKLLPFPGYDEDQWGIKAHNRPWVEAAGEFSAGQRVLEVGGAYSSLPAALAERYGIEAWVADDFGVSIGEEALFRRWGDPSALPKKYPRVRYVFEAVGGPTSSLPETSFDCVFSVSTLEHIPWSQIPSVLRHMHRLLKPGGRQLHSIDIPVAGWKHTMVELAEELLLHRLRRPSLLSFVRPRSAGLASSHAQVSMWARTAARRFPSRTRSSLHRY